MRRKSKVKLIIVMMLIIAIMTTFLFLFFKTDFFRTKRSAFLRYFNNIPEALDLLKDEDLLKYSSEKKSSPYIRKATVTIQDSSNIANSEILDKIRLQINEKTDNKNKKGNIEFDIYNGDNKLSNISYVQNKNTVGLYSEDVAKGYICINNSDLQRIATDAEVTEWFVPNQISFVSIDEILKTSKNEKNRILNVTKILSTDVPDNAYTKETHNQVTINNKIYTGTAYTLNLDSTDTAKLESDVLSKISQDSILMDYITSKAKLLGFSNQYTSINDLNKLMKNRISDLQKDPSIANSLKIVTHEFKQENIETEIKTGDLNIVIQHVKGDSNEYASIQINEKKYSVEKTNGNYIFGYSNEENDEALTIDYSRTGDIENNNIKNTMTIKHKTGIKQITYLYNDEISFTNDIGQIKNFEGYTTVTLNDMKDEELKLFAKLLKNRINDVYISKGASVGINLDPLFVYE